MGKGKNISYLMMIAGRGQMGRLVIIYPDGEGNPVANDAEMSNCILVVEVLNERTKDLLIELHECLEGGP